MSLPVYGDIANLMNENPSLVKTVNPEDLQPLLQLRLLSPEAKKALHPYHVLVERLNENHQLALNMADEELLNLLKYSDEVYYGTNTGPLLQDRVYDYVKRLHGQRVHMTMDKQKTMQSVSSDTGVGVKPVKGRDTRLPVALRSLDNVFMGEGDVDKWTASHPGPYNLSAKMDGTSALYYQGVLYTRGDATVGRNISHLLAIFNLPEVQYAVRGEIVMDKHVFEQKYKDQPSKTGAVRKINRNSVAGALSTITNQDEGFFQDLKFVAYEIINMQGTQLRPSEQFRKLKQDGFLTAQNKVVEAVSDKILSAMYHDLIKTYNYEVDGVVLQVNQPYTRESSKNPDYAKSYKEALEQDVAVTTVISIEWNVSQYGYLVPTVIYEPVTIGGVTLQRATAHNARDVQQKGLGAGAVIEVVYRAKVNPQVNRVLKAVKPEMPQVPYKWLDEVNIVTEDDSLDSIRVKRIHKFLIEIGAKGIGELTVEKIYKSTQYRTVGDFINMKQEHLAFLGKQISLNIFESVKTAMQKIDLPTLMASSKVFGRGLGTKKFMKIFDEYPDFAARRHSYEDYIHMFKQVDGFADKTASLAAKGMVDFWEFIDTQLSPEIYHNILANTGSVQTQTQTQAESPLKNKNIYMTGVRSQEVIDHIKKLGAVLQESFTGATDVLIRKNTEYNNRKTETAQQKGLPVLTVEEFLRY
jgi:NAD-dependent DNA ligase